METPASHIDFDLIGKLDRNGPRYTSYPTADRFSARFTAADYARSAAQRNVVGMHRSLSLYVHLPFGSSLCHDCACNRIATRDGREAKRYIDGVMHEIALQAPLFGDDVRVTQMHWGGGTPTWSRTGDLERLFTSLRALFDLDPAGEYAIDIDPRSVDASSIEALRAMGLNRASFGVQDFDANLQAATNRVQSEAQTASAVEASRRAGFESIDVELIYGLPGQDLLMFNRTLARVLAMRPERIGLRNYAHRPSRFRSQRLIPEVDMPWPKTTLQLVLAARRLAEAGYVHIGMEHFALPQDPLAVAQREGRLHRNFQGYSTHAQCDLVGLGVSAIGSIGATYSQNTRVLSEYYGRIGRGELPVTRGHELSGDDLLRRSVIHTLMCHFELSKEAIEVAYLIDFDRYFAPELRALADLERAGLIRMEDGWISVSPGARMLIRNVCMVFDKYLWRERSRVRYPQIL